MIVGTKDIDIYDLGQHCGSIAELRSYCDSLVPRILQHDKRICDNQRYLVALYVRTIKSIPWVSRKQLYEGLLEDVAVHGLINEVYDLDDVMMSIDVDKIAEYINDGGNDGYNRIKRLHFTDKGDSKREVDGDIPF